MDKDQLDAKFSILETPVYQKYVFYQLSQENLILVLILVTVLFSENLYSLEIELTDRYSMPHDTVSCSVQKSKAWACKPKSRGVTPHVS